MKGPLLCVAGEASGDSAVAQVLAHIPEVDAFGLGGSAMAARGVSLTAHLQDTTAMGFSEAALRLPRLYQIRRELLGQAEDRKAKVALLFNYSDFSVSLLKPLAALGVRTLFYSPPQVWAWRPQRARMIATHTALIATILPFEEPLWQAMGAKATYVGHPALEREWAAHSRAEPPHHAGTGTGTGMQPRIAILPGSRPEEIRRILPVMLEAFQYVDPCRAQARVLVAPSLDSYTRNAIHTLATHSGITCLDISADRGLAAVLPSFNYSLCTSGTATLESVLAGVPPVVVYKVSRLTAAIARTFVHTPYIALPNIILARHAFPELLQRDATGERIGRALALATHPALHAKQQANCRAVAAYLQQTLSPQWRTPSTHVAHLLKQMA